VIDGHLRRLLRLLPKPPADLLDAACGPQIRTAPTRGDVRLALSNSFGFGGNNCVLVFGRAPR